MTRRVVMRPLGNVIAVGVDCSPIEYAFRKPMGLWYRVHATFCAHFEALASDQALQWIDSAVRINPNPYAR